MPTCSGWLYPVVAMVMNQYINATGSPPMPETVSGILASNRGCLAVASISRGASCVERAPATVALRRWQTFAILHVFVNMSLGNEVSRDRRGQEQECKDQYLVHREPALGKDEVETRCHEDGADTQGRGFGWCMQAGHELAQLDQSGGTHQQKDAADDDENGDYDFY